MTWLQLTSNPAPLFPLPEMAYPMVLTLAALVLAAITAPTHGAPIVDTSFDLPDLSPSDPTHINAHLRFSDASTSDPTHINAHVPDHSTSDPTNINANLGLPYLSPADAGFISTSFSLPDFSHARPTPPLLGLYLLPNEGPSSSLVSADFVPEETNIYSEEVVPQCFIHSATNTYLSTYQNFIAVPITSLYTVNVMRYLSTTVTEHTTKTETVQIEDMISKYFEYQLFSTITEFQTSTQFVPAITVSKTHMTTTTLTTLHQETRVLWDTVVLPQTKYETTTERFEYITTKYYPSTSTVYVTLSTPTMTHRQTMTLYSFVINTFEAPLAFASSYVTHLVTYARDTTLPASTSTFETTVFTPTFVYRTTSVHSTTTVFSTLYNTIKSTQVTTSLVNELLHSTTTFTTVVHQTVTISRTVMVDAHQVVPQTSTTIIYTPITKLSTTTSTVVSTKTDYAEVPSTTVTSTQDVTATVTSTFSQSVVFETVNVKAPCS